jgi:hypothetical protein
MSLWTTRAYEPVGPGDLVALSVLSHADAVGRIVESNNLNLNLIQCVLVRGNHVKPGTIIEVEQEQLLVRVYN